MWNPYSKNRLYFVTKSSLLFSSIAVTALAFSYILGVGTRSYAEGSGIYAAIVIPFRGNSNNLTVREDGNTQPKPFRTGKNERTGVNGSYNDLRRSRDVLEVEADGQSGARLVFTYESTSVKDKSDLLIQIQTTPSRKRTEYRFPCEIKGGDLTIGWREASAGRDQDCDDGVRVGPGVTKTSLNFRNFDFRQSAKKMLIAQASDDDVIVAPSGNGQQMDRIIDSDKGIVIIPVIGDARVTSAQFPQGRILRKGERYTYFGNGQGTIDNVDLRPIINSPAMQDFLNPDNWSSPGISQRVADGITDQIADHRAALGLPTIGSRPTNNTGQEPPVSSSGTSSTCPLTGQWQYSSPTDFAYDPQQGFFDARRPYSASVEITESGNQITISGFYLNSSGSGQGQKLGTQVTANLPLRFGNGQLTGTIRDTGLTIVGQILFSDGQPGHSTVTIPFKMERQPPFASLDAPVDAPDSRASCPE